MQIVLIVVAAFVVPALVWAFMFDRRHPRYSPDISRRVREGSPKAQSAYEEIGPRDVHGDIGGLGG